jgi:peptide/nickel transport system substrate-binding protein
VNERQDPSEFGVGQLDELVHKRRISRRSFLTGAAAVGAAAALGSAAAACGGGGSSSTSSSSAAASPSGPKQGGAIRSAIGGGSAKDTLDGQIPTSETQIGTQWQIYDALMGWDKDHKLEMLLADSYEANADGSQWTVKLKSGLTFHDGSPVTADAVIFSYKRILDPKTGAPGAGTMADLKPSGLKKVDDLTVQFNLEKPNVIFYEAMAYYPNAIVPVGYAPKGMEGAIGTGPWIPTSFNPGQQVEFKANPDYWGEGPHADTLTMIEFADPTAKLNALLGGDVDHMTLLDSSQAATVQGTAGMKVLQAKTGGWYPFTMRMDQKPFDDVRVRQAFRLMMDRQQMIEQAMGGYAWVGNDMYAPYDPGYPSDLPQRAADVEQAKSLLKQAGYDNDLTVELTTSTAVASSAVLAAQVFAQQAKAAGVTFKVNKVDPSVFYGDQYLSWTFAQDFWATRNYLPQVQVGTAPNALWNECHWKDDPWWGLVQQALKTVDDTARADLIKQAATIEYDTGAYIVYQFNVLLDAYSDKLTGVVEDTWGANSACRCRYNLMSFA